ncbi:MAG: hypothetical protein IGS23_14010 [Rivularia sp. T60_A2020_040]|nr:hypothetical protein [Rivularia sp. T60_A2020_040]
MTAYYNDAKDGVTYSNVNPKWEEANITFHFDEALIKKDDTFYYLFMYVTKASGVNKYGADKNWTMPEEVTLLKIAHSEYKKKDYKTKETSTVNPSECEKMYSSLFENLDLNQIYSGTAWFTNSPQIEQINTGVSSKGKPLDEDVRQSLLETYWSVEIVDNPEKLAKVTLEIPKSYSGYSGGKSSQLESEKIKDRLKFVATQLQEVFPDKEIATIHDISSLLNDSKTAGATATILDLCKDFIR